MKYPKKVLFGKTWIGWLNYILLQWLFIRLEGTQYYYIDRYYLTWRIRFCRPLTGWKTSYVPKNRILWDICKVEWKT